ncbi:MAG TPA: GNAT family N-acetyltransferase [Solirubrobacteraceae bacterium]|jgi:GNAT superfamily N-acetyltransferase
MATPGSRYRLTRGRVGSTEQLVEAGGYGYAHSCVTSENFPVRSIASAPPGDVVLLAFDRPVNAGEVLTEAARLGLDRPSYEDALHFGAEHPAVQREHPVVFLHEPWVGFFGRRDVLCLWSNAGRRELGLEGFDDAWSPAHRFAFIARAATPTRSGDGAALTVARADIRSPEAQALIRALNGELSSRYPEDGATHFRLDADEVAPGRGAFLIAQRAGTPIGCGAVRRLATGTAEIKRMYVRPEARGQRVGAAVLGALEAEARALGCARLVLETGVRQVEALALYERAGFGRIPPFGEYAGSPLSVCMAKDLGTEGRA